MPPSRRVWRGLGGPTGKSFGELASPQSGEWVPVGVGEAGGAQEEGAWGAKPAERWESAHVGVYTHA